MAQRIAGMTAVGNTWGFLFRSIAIVIGVGALVFLIPSAISYFTIREFILGWVESLTGFGGSSFSGPQDFNRLANSANTFAMTSILILLGVMVVYALAAAFFGGFLAKTIGDKQMGRFDLGASIQSGVSKMLPVFIANLIRCILTFIVVIIASLILGVVHPILGLLGYIAGWLIMTALTMLTTPLIVLGNRGAFSALGDSVGIGTKNLLPLCGALFMNGIILFIFFIVMGLVNWVVASLLGAVGGIIVSVAVTVVFMAVADSLATHAYVLHEGPGGVGPGNTDSQAAVFN